MSNIVARVGGHRNESVQISDTAGEKEFLFQRRAFSARVASEVSKFLKGSEEDDRDNFDRLLDILPLFVEELNKRKDTSAQEDITVDFFLDEFSASDISQLIRIYMANEIPEEVQVVGKNKARSNKTVN